MSDLRYDDVRAELRAAVRALLADRSPWPAVLARTESAEPYDPKLWGALAADMGLAGLAIPERLGGAGAGFGEVGVVLEELGRAVAPVPYLGSAVVATRALLSCALDNAAEGIATRAAAPTAAQAVAQAAAQAVARELLGRLAVGQAVAALAVPFSTAPGAVPVGVEAEGDVLTGRVTSVADALPATDLLVPAAGALYLVDAADPAVRRTTVVSLDATRQLCDVELAGVTGRPIATGDAAATAVTGALVTGAALLASEQLGVAQWCLDSTVEYVRTRHQFGRPVGSFQAVKHRLADLWVELTQARAVAEHAAANADDPLAAALAQAHCGPAALRAARECVQLHGGIGFTWEHPAHLYLKRATSAAIGYGTADRHRAALAPLVNLPPAD
jgi:alkylation response protein AidB-like acyl-CoA dehydrogenase